MNDNSLVSQGGAAEFYTSHNIWYEHANRIWSINYKKGALIPAGSRVTGVNLTTGRNPRLDFSWDQSGMRFSVHIQPKFHPGINPSQYASRMLTPATLEQLTEGFTQDEMLCVTRGIITAGISKKACLVAYGYPPEHFTPSLDADRWYYWVNRFMKKELVFDAQGLTVSGI